ncbi:hypothetical protein B6S44_01555 [Bosea sp. Tri-44]|nr:hypothetical protein B6S44_01555 [Bosea sp. Tri-44]
MAYLPPAIAGAADTISGVAQTPNQRSRQCAVMACEIRVRWSDLSDVIRLFDRIGIRQKAVVYRDEDVAARQPVSRLVRFGAEAQYNTLY